MDAPSAPGGSPATPSRPPIRRPFTQPARPPRASYGCMRGKLFLSRSRTLFFAGLLLAGLMCASGTAVALHAQVPRLDDMQFRGVWYEISHVPDKREKLCVGDTVQLVARGDKPHQLLLSDACDLKGGETATWSFVAAPAKHHDDGRLRIPFLLLLHHDYWVYAYDAAGQWCVVGSPNHRQGWIYARSPALPADALAQAQAAAAAAGFNMARLKQTPQPNPPRG